MYDDLLITKNFYLYVSENFEVFLHKSENYITFKNITVPPFIIDPNTTIIFSDIRCDLSNSKFIMKKEGDFLQKTLNKCKYNSNDKQISCNIIGTFYTNVQYYNNYYYTIDDKNITFFYNNSK